MSLIDKYKPKNLSQVVGNKSQIQSFRNWILSFSNDSDIAHKNSITVSGPHGSGKKLIIELFLREFDYEPLYITSSNIKTFFDKAVTKTQCAKKGKISEMDNPLSQLLISNADINENSLVRIKKKAIIISDAEKITLSKEINILISLCNCNEKIKLTPLIFITNDQHSKLMTSIKNLTMDIAIQYPTEKELLRFVNRVCEQEEIHFNDEKLKTELIDFVQYNIRHLLMFLEDLHDIYGDKSITLKDCKDYIKSSKQKGQNNKLFPSAKMILDDYQGIIKCQDIFEQNNMVIFPLMLYENYPVNLENRQCPNSEYYGTCLDIIDTISRSDVISTSIYTEQNWYLQRLYGFVACCETTYKLNKKPMKNRDYNIKFSSDMVDVSIQNISKKSIMEIKKVLFNITLGDILMMKKYYDNLIRLNKLKALKSSLKIYNISDSNFATILTKLLKIDKTKPATKITGKTKKYLKLLQI